jgi:hypothetical protein
MGYSSRFLGATPVSTPVDVVAAPSWAVGLESPGAAAGVPLTGGAGLTGAGATGAAWDTGMGTDGAGVTVRLTTWEVGAGRVLGRSRVHPVRCPT